MFSFRTHKTFNRFLAAIKASILQFANDNQKKMFLTAISSEDFSVRENCLYCFGSWFTVTLFLLK